MWSVRRCGGGGPALHSWIKSKIEDYVDGAELLRGPRNAALEVFALSPGRIMSPSAIAFEGICHHRRSLDYIIKNVGHEFDADWDEASRRHDNIMTTGPTRFGRSWTGQA